MVVFKSLFASKLKIKETPLRMLVEFETNIVTLRDNCTKNQVGLRKFPRPGKKKDVALKRSPT